MAEEHKKTISNLREERRKSMEQLDTQEEELEEQNKLIIQLNYEKQAAIKEVIILEQTAKEQKDEIKTSHKKIQHFEELAAQDECEKLV